MNTNKFEAEISALRNRFDDGHFKPACRGAGYLEKESSGAQPETEQLSGTRPARGRLDAIFEAPRPGWLNAVLLGLLLGTLAMVSLALAFKP